MAHEKARDDAIPRLRKKRKGSGIEMRCPAYTDKRAMEYIMETAALMSPFPKSTSLNPIKAKIIMKIHERSNSKEEYVKRTNTPMTEMAATAKKCNISEESRKRERKRMTERMAKIHCPFRIITRVVTVIRGMKRRKLTLLLR
jgi:hypothetical protein